MIKSHWLELPISRTNFHGPKDVRAIEVWLYISLQDQGKAITLMLLLLPVSLTKTYFPFVSFPLILCIILPLLTTIIHPKYYALKFYLIEPEKRIPAISMCAQRTQISLCNKSETVWKESLLCVLMITKSLHTTSELRSVCADAQADLGLHWVHMYYCRNCWLISKRFDFI